MKSISALLLVDIQIGAFDGEKIQPVDNAEKFIENVSLLLTSFRNTNKSVFYIQDCGRIGGAFEEGSKHWPIHPDIAPRTDEVVIPKKGPCGFDGTNLHKVLKESGIEELVICGLHSQHCYTSISLSAIGKGYRVVTVSDGHATCSNNEESSQEIIDRQNKLLQSSGAVLKSTNEILES